MFSDCSGECIVCQCSGFCLAGHGDDDFSPLSKEQIIEKLNSGVSKFWLKEYPLTDEEINTLKDFLLNHYGYEYK